MGPYQSLLGVVAILFMAWLCSSGKRSINWRTVLLAFGLQVAFGAVALYLPEGRALFTSMANGFSHVLSFADSGISFLFGPLADLKKTGFIFAVNVLGVIVFFASLLSVLYHLKIMQFIIRVLGGFLERLLGTSRVESMYAVANVFLGMSESPLAIKPYVEGLTRSELFTVMTCGMAAVAGSVLAGYAAMGVEMKFLITASFMAAPGAIVMSKMMIPEMEEKRQDEVSIHYENHANILDAAAHGASSGVVLAMNVGAMLLAFTALIALLNGMLGWAGSFFGDAALSLQQVLGYVFSPLAWLLGVSWHEASSVGSLVGQKVVVNEFVAYAGMAKISHELTQHSTAIATFALCGFANLSSIAIQLGLLGSIAPSRRGEVARLGLRAVLAGTFSNLMSASLAGFFMALHG